MDWLKETINLLTSPALLYIESVFIFALVFWKSEFFARPKVAAILAGTGLVFFLWAITDVNFMTIVGKADNIPISIMIVLVAWLTWYSLHRGVENDKRIQDGKGPIEKEQSGRAMTWPNLLYIEFIALIAVTVFLIFWSILFNAPLEEPANLTLTPNPSKAPWYFLGLQEMLVYFDPWLAGVVYPGLIVVGLMAIPYIDKNPKGNGYFTFKERKFAISIFLFGFIIQWFLLIVLGTFMRGPGWNFYGPFEYWDPHKIVALTNVNLSEIFWVKFLGSALPSNILLRESLGFAVVIGYLVALPPLFSGEVFKKIPALRKIPLLNKLGFFQKFYHELGFVRYNVMCFLFLAFMSLPIKMFLRWTINLKYLIAIPEHFFNI